MLLLEFARIAVELGKVPLEFFLLGLRRDQPARGVVLDELVGFASLGKLGFAGPRDPLGLGGIHIGVGQRLLHVIPLCML